MTFGSLATRDPGSGAACNDRREYGRHLCIPLLGIAPLVQGHNCTSTADLDKSLMVIRVWQTRKAMNCYSEPSHDCEAIYIGLWGALIVMTWLQFGGTAIYVPAHARPPILARMLGLAGLGSQATGTAVNSHGSALEQVHRASPDLTDVRPPSDARRRATSWFEPAPALNDGYYVAHSDAEHSSAGPDGEELSTNA
jgi:hypothetical protein